MELIIKDISKSYGEKKALSNFSAQISSGEIVGVIGKNGAGKTTLLNALVGNINIDSGDILFNSESIINKRDLVKNFGILIEPSFLDYMNTYDNLKLLMNAEGISDKEYIDNQLDEVLKLVGLHDKKKSYVRSFSFGMKQRLGLAQALLNNKEILILDEPLVGLDAFGRELVKDLILHKAKKEGKAIIFSDHNLDEVKSICDRIIYIDNGLKKYDDVFRNNEEYVIELKEQPNNNIINEIKSKFSNLIKIKENKIFITEINHLNSILKILVNNNLYIEKISILEDSLLRLFKQGSE